MSTITKPKVQEESARLQTLNQHISQKEKELETLDLDLEKKRGEGKWETETLEVKVEGLKSEITLYETAVAGLEESKKEKQEVVIKLQRVANNLNNEIKELYEEKTALDVDVNARKRELEIMATERNKKQEQLNEQETIVALKETLAKELMDANEKEAQRLSVYDEKVQAREAGLTERERMVSVREADIESSKNLVENEKKSLEREKEQLVNVRADSQRARGDADERVREADRKIINATNKEEEVKAKEKNLRQQDKELKEREEEYRMRSEELEVKERQVKLREKQLNVSH